MRHSTLDKFISRQLESRKEYGTMLFCFNGRNPLIDAYQEKLDFCMYIRQAINEVSSNHRNRWNVSKDYAVNKEPKPIKNEEYPVPVIELIRSDFHSIFVNGKDPVFPSHVSQLLINLYLDGLEQLHILEALIEEYKK